MSYFSKLRGESNARHGHPQRVHRAVGGPGSASESSGGVGANSPPGSGTVAGNSTPAEVALGIFGLTNALGFPGFVGYPNNNLTITPEVEQIDDEISPEDPNDPNDPAATPPGNMGMNDPGEGEGEGDASGDGAGAGGDAGGGGDGGSALKRGGRARR